MNEELLRLLTLLGVEGLARPDAWQRVVMVLNDGRVPARDGVPPVGFKLLLLDDAGRPEWFARCSWTTRAEMLRETTVLETLTHDALCRQHIPEVRTAHTDRIFVQLTRHLGVQSYSGALQALGPAAWSRDVEEIVTLTRAMMERAAGLLPALRTQRSVEDRQRAIAADLARVEGAGLDTTALMALREALETVRDLPFHLQHGDLWPGNVLRQHDRWWIIDFAECGVVWVPLYDTLHMLHMAPKAAQQLWYAAPDAPADAWTTARRTLAHRTAAARGLDARQLGACLVFYLMHLCAYRLRPGVPRQWSAPLLQVLERVGAALAAGLPLEALIPAPDAQRP